MGAIGRAAAALWRSAGLTVKFTLPVVLLTAAWSLVAVVAIAVPTLSDEFRAAEQRRSLAIATMVEAEYLHRPDSADLTAFLRYAAARDPSIVLIRIYRVVAGAPTIWASSISDIEVGQPAEEHDVEPLRRGGPLQMVTRQGGEDVLETIMAIQRGPGADATVGVYTALAPFNEAVARVVRDLAGVVLLMFLSQVASLLLLVHLTVVRRIAKLDAAARHLAAGDAVAPVASGAARKEDDEIGRVARSFDEMAQAVAARRAALEREAETDGLTGLLNRRAFDERIAVEVDRAVRIGYALSLSLVDLDGLKTLNDARGHLAGDDALRRVGLALPVAVRGSDIVARYGGDEFVVIHPGCSAADARAVASRIRDAVEALRIPVGVTDAVLTASAGTAQLRAGGSVVDLLANADEEMYRGKRAQQGTEVSRA